MATYRFCGALLSGLLAFRRNPFTLFCALNKKEGRRAKRENWNPEQSVQDKKGLGRAMRLLQPVLFVFIVLAFTESSAASPLSVPLTLSGDVGRPVPVTTGVPLPEGVVVNPRDLRLLRPDGSEAPLQTRTLSQWKDGSVRWVLLDFQTEGTTEADPSSSGSWTLILAPDRAGPHVNSPVRIEETPRGIHVDTGPLQFTVSKTKYNGIEGVTVENRPVIPPDHNQGLAIDLGSGRVSLSNLAPTEVIVEEAGPLRAVVRAASSYQSPDGVVIDFILRVYAYAGETFVRLDQTFINRTNQVLRLNELAMEYPVAEGLKEYALAGDGDTVIRGTLTNEGVQLLQSPNHPFGLFAAHKFQVFEGAGVVASGNRSLGWMHLTGSTGSVTVAVQDFWQLYPKGLRASQHSFAIDLWPQGALPQPAGHMDINGGAAKTHQILIAFDESIEVTSDGNGTPDLVRWLNQPTMAIASPQWYSATKAAGKGAISPAVVDGHVVHPEYENWVDWMVRERYLARRIERDEFGMMHFGDYLLGNNVWNSLQYDLPRSFMQQFYRTGDRWFFDRAAEMVRNQRDVLVLWHENIANGRRVHRAYGGNPRNGEPHGLLHGGEAMLFIGGMVDHYLMTGDWQTRAALLFVADGIANVSGSQFNWFRNGNWRAAGYPLAVLADAYQLTRDERYRDAAVRILHESVFSRAHTRANGFPEAIADGVWWHTTGSSWSTDPNADRYQIQAWQIDQMGDGLYSVYEILEDGPVKEQLRRTLLDLADFAIEHAWNPERKGWNQWVYKDQKGNYTTSNVYDGFMGMLGVTTMARAYTLTGDRRYLEMGRQMFDAAVADRTGVVEGKQVGQSMEYAPVFIATWDEAMGHRP